MSGKHLTGPTITEHPQLYPCILKHTRSTDIQKKLLKQIEASPRAEMSGAPDEAAFLSFLCKIIGAKKVLEVGVFMGYTTLAIALALPEDGKIMGLDINEEWVNVGRKAWEEAKVSSKIEIRFGSAVETINQLVKSEAGTYDLVFIDADKVNYLTYYELSLSLLRKGGIIAIDNVLWSGGVIESPETQSAESKTFCTLNDKIYSDARVEQCMLGIADGLTLVCKL